MSKLSEKVPRVRIAIIKRVYWKKLADPRNCWCASHENTWTAVAAPILQSAEELLLYMHESQRISKQIQGSHKYLKET